MKPEILYEVKAQRGDTLRCKGWKQETLLRMLENNMENAEAPEYLVIYGGIGVVRHAQAGYETARRTAEGKGPLTKDSIKVPLWWSPVATFGPEGGRQLRRSAHTKA